MTGEPGPEVFARVTPSLPTGVPTESLSVTVMVEVEVPSASTAVGEASTVDWPAFTGPAGVPADTPPKRISESSNVAAVVGEHLKVVQADMRDTGDLGDCLVCTGAVPLAGPCVHPDTF